jgi:hypothetical protein
MFSNVKSIFHSNVMLTTLMSKLIAIIRGKAPAQLLSSAHNKVHTLTIYLFLFLKSDPISNVHLSTAWEPSELGNISVFPLTVVFLNPPPNFLFSLTLYFFKGLKKNEHAKKKERKKSK